MRARGGFVTAAMAVVAAVAGLAAYDATNADRIAPGVRIGGADVGGLSRAEARELVEHRLAPTAVHAVSVEFGPRNFELSPAASRVRLDAAATADAARS